MVPKHVPPSPDASEYRTWLALWIIGRVLGGIVDRFLNHHLSSLLSSLLRRVLFNLEYCRAISACVLERPIRPKSRD